MKDKDIDARLRQCLSGDPPRRKIRQHALRDSTAMFARVSRQRSARRRAKLAAAAVLIAGIAFLGGRLSMPRRLPGSADPVPRAIADRDGVTVPDDLVAWLDAARLFRHLGMEDRMTRAVERAARLLPADASIANGQTPRVLAAGSIDNQTERVEPMGISGPHPSAESIDQILAQSFGD